MIAEALASTLVAGDDGEEPESLGVTGEVGESRRGMRDEADDDEHDQYGVGSRGDDVQDVGEPVDGPAARRRWR